MFNLSKNYKNILKLWLPLAVTITCLCGLIYLVIQQDIRIGANDPQIQIAQDVARELSQGVNPQYFIPQGKVELSKSMATYIMLFDKNGNLAASSVSLNGKNPSIPKGVFASSKDSPTKETRFTWQPQNGVRSAVVVDYYQGKNADGFVLVGRSIREVEIRESQQELIVFLGWVFTMLASLASVVVLQKIK